MDNTKEYTVYMHINKINGKKYVGITNQKPEYRWRSDGSGYFRSPYFWSAIQKYGWDNFEHIILLEGISREDACNAEKHYIALYNTNNKKFGYNMTDGGDGSCGWHPSEETIRKRSEKLRGVTRSEEHKMAISKANTGRKASDETKRKLRESHLGKKLTGGQLEKTLDNLKKISERRKKKVYCVDQNENTYEFNSIKEASEFFNEPTLGKNFKTIVETGRIVNGRRWYYKEE